jgi:hypothetical protein
MPRKWLLCLLLAPLATARADAQNSDLALLAGIAGPHGRVVVGPNPIASGSVGAGGQINYAWQVLQQRRSLHRVAARIHRRILGDGDAWCNDLLQRHRHLLHARLAAQDLTAISSFVLRRSWGWNRFYRRHAGYGQRYAQRGEQPNHNSGGGFRRRTRFPIDPLAELTRGCPRFRISCGAPLIRTKPMDGPCRYRLSFLIRAECQESRNGLADTLRYSSGLWVRSSRGRPYQACETISSPGTP